MIGYAITIILNNNTRRLHIAPIIEVKMGKNETESDRMMVFEFVIKNFNLEITVAEMANHVNLTENFFSRYFSNRTRITFITFVNQVRLSHAANY